MLEMKNLQKALDKFNAPQIIDGDEFKSNFKFTTRREGNLLFIYDEYENYHIDYLEELNWLMHDCAEEFGTEFKPILVDEIHEEIKEAIKKDFGESADLDWYDNVAMCVGLWEE